MTAVQHEPSGFSMPPAAVSDVDDEQKLRDALIRALKREGFGRLCRKEKDPEPKVRGGFRLAVVELFTARAIRIATWMSLGFAAARVLDADDWIYVVVAAGAIGIGTWALPGELVRRGWPDDDNRLRKAMNSATAVFGLLIAYGIVAAIELSSGGFDALAVTYGLPLALVLILGTLYAFGREAARILRGRVPRLERGAALVFPIGVVALFVQLFTTEVWTAAHTLHERQLLWLTGLTVLPLVVFLHRRLRASVPEAFGIGAERLVGDASPEGRAELLESVWQLLGDDDARSDRTHALVSEAFHKPTVEARARAILPEVKGTFDIPLALGLVPMIIGVWLVMALYVYALAWATVDVGVAGEWLGSGPVETRTAIELPWGPYPVLAAFLGIVATAVFLALALTEEEYKELLTESAIHRPVQRCLMIGIPYRYLQVKHDRRGAALRLPEDRSKHADDNRLATADEDDHDRAASGSGHSLWYRWKAPESEWFSFAAESHEFDPMVAVYEVGGARAVAQSANGRPARFRASSGEHYDVAVDGAAAGRGRGCGTFTLSWFPTPAPANDHFAAAEPIDGLEGAVNGDSTFAHGDPHDHGNTGLPGAAPLWYRWTAADDRWMRFAVESQGFGIGIAVLTGTSPAALVPITRNDSAHGEPCQVQLHAQPDTEYHIVVDALEGGRGPFSMSWAPAPSPPANDDFADAAPIGGDRDEVVGTTANATREPHEPRHAGRQGGRSIWYRWTAPSDAWMEFSTEDSSFDTLLAVYTGSALKSLSLVAANDDVPGALFSRVRFEARKGAEYHIAVDGYAGVSGEVHLRWAPASAPPANAEFGRAVVLAGTEDEVTASNALAFAEPGEPRHAGRPGGKSLWYRWTAPRDCWMHFSTDGSSFDTLLAVYTGDRLTELTLVAENDDAPGRLTSFVRFAARSGTEYRIAVDGHGGESGDVRLSWVTGPAPPRNDAFDDAEPIAGGAGDLIASNLYASREEGEPRHADRSGGASVWYRWTPARTGWVTFATAGSDFDTVLAAYVGRSVDRLDAVAANDDVSESDSTSRIAFHAVGGVEYRIVVDGFFGATGDVRLSWAPLPVRRALPYWWANRKLRHADTA